jgi:hypothetical protein
VLFLWCNCFLFLVNIHRCIDKIVLKPTKIQSSPTPVSAANFTAMVVKRTLNWWGFGDGTTTEGKPLHQFLFGDIEKEEPNQKVLNESLFNVATAPIAEMLSLLEQEVGLALIVSEKIDEIERSIAERCFEQQVQSLLQDNSTISTSELLDNEILKQCVARSIDIKKFEDRTKSMEEAQLSAHQMESIRNHQKQLKSIMKLEALKSEYTKEDLDMLEKITKQAEKNRTDLEEKMKSILDFWVDKQTTKEAPVILEEDLSIVSCTKEQQNKISILAKQFGVKYNNSAKAKEAKHEIDAANKAIGEHSKYNLNDELKKRWE